MRYKQPEPHSVHPGTSRRKAAKRQRYWRRRTRRRLATMQRRWEVVA